jgi:plasmid maintenance system antidote protein VapI
MGKMIDTTAAAQRLGVTAQRMQQLCREREVIGAKMGG